MNLLVTGAAGRVGANAAKRLVDDGWDVRAMVMPNDPQAYKVRSMRNVEVVEADLGDQRAINEACRGVTHVLHLAAQLGRGATPVDRYYDINAFGTLRLLEACLTINGGVERFVLTSTDGTYRPGDPPAIPLTEDTPQRPADYYGTSKLLGEIILLNHAAQFDIPYSIVRFATVVSPEESVSLFTVSGARALLGRSRMGKEANIWQLFQGDKDLLAIFEQQMAGVPDEAAVALTGPTGSPWTIHLADVRDAVQGVILALTEPGAQGGVFNIAAAQPTSFDEGARVLSELAHVPKVSAEMPKDWRLEVSIEAAKAALGYKPRYDYRDMVEASMNNRLEAEDSYITVK